MRCKRWSRFGLAIIVGLSLVQAAAVAAASPTDPAGVEPGPASARPTPPVPGASNATGRTRGASLHTIPLDARSGGLDGLPPGHQPAPPASGSLPADARPVVYTDEIEVAPFQLAAVTWQGDATLTTWVRTRSDGSWSEWLEVPRDDDHAPDPDTEEAAASRQGTDPLLVPESEAVQVRIDAPGDGIPNDLRLDLVDPGDVAADESFAATDTAATDVAATAASAEDIGVAASAVRPPIYTRAQWGADESLRDGSPSYGVVNGAFVHHTVNSNSYSADQVPALIRSIYVYHVQARGWSDIGYNFIVDRFGRIWEGRYGGVTRAVIGAHTAGYNDDAFAMSALGTYETTAPSSSMIWSYQRLFAWKFALHGVDPRYPVSYDGERWRAIAGHRDAAQTACPGDALYARIAQIRRGTITAMGLSPSRDLDDTGSADLAAVRTDGTLWFLAGRSSGGYAAPRQIGQGWNAMNAIVMPGDWDGGRHDDMIARRGSDGSLWLYPMAGSAVFATPRLIGNGWNSMNAIVASGDWDGDAVPDLIARRRSDGSLRLYPGNGSGGFRSSRQIGTGWAGMNAIAGAGDWDGDNAPDLVARRASDGSLWLYPGTGRGGFRSPRQIGVGWGGYVIVGAGDVDRDGRADLVARTPAYALVLYPGNGSGGFRARQTLSSGWQSFPRLV